MKVFCIISDKRVFRSKSPAIFSAVMKHLGIGGAYVPFMVEPDQIGQALESLRVLNIAGANLTVPYKEVSIPYVDELSEGARFIGAINTIVCKGKVLKGYNTNAIGFMDVLNDVDFDVAGKSALVFGTGGIAKAVVFILNWLRTSSVTVTGRSDEKIDQIVNQFGCEAKPLRALLDTPIQADLVINATAVSSPGESPELAELVRNLEVAKCKLVMDLNYGRSQNFWQDMARSKDIPFMDGLPALAFQARRTFALWTGIQVPPEEFLKALGVEREVIP